MQEQIVSKAVSVLKSDGVIIHPTDTCYGLACSIFSEKGLEHLYDLKHMPREKPISILVSSIEQAKEYGEWNDLAETLANAYWPGPLTIVLKRTEKLPVFINPSIDSVGIRFPDHEVTHALIEQLGHPITTTSANISGEPEPYLIESLKITPDFLIDGSALRYQKASTVVDISKGEIHILRRGPIDLEEGSSTT